jgi:hypothetical protein
MPATTGVYPELAEGLPHTCACSTIGLAGLTLRVRDAGWADLWWRGAADSSCLAALARRNDKGLAGVAVERTSVRAGAD